MTGGQAWRWCHKQKDMNVQHIEIFINDSCKYAWPLIGDFCAEGLSLWVPYNLTCFQSAACKAICFCRKNSLIKTLPFVNDRVLGGWGERRAGRTRIWNAREMLYWYSSYHQVVKEMSEKRKASILVLLMPTRCWWIPALLLRDHFYDPFISVIFFLKPCSCLQSSLLTIKVFELTFYILGWHSFLIVSGFLLQLGSVRDLWVWGREPDPSPSGCGVPAFCPCAGVAVQLAEAAQPGERAARNSGGVRGATRNREPLCMC